MRRLGLIVTTACLLLGAAVPAADAATSAPGNLMVLNADGGTLEPAAGGWLDLTLRGVGGTVTWFSDHPRRKAGTASLRTMVRDWARFGYVKDRPNAAIELPGGTTDADTLIVELGRPRYDRRADVLRVRVRRITPTSTVGGHAKGADRKLPRRFGRVSVFVDDTTSSLQVKVINQSGHDVLITQPQEEPLAVANGQQGRFGLPISGGSWQYFQVGTRSGGCSVRWAILDTGPFLQAETELQAGGTPFTVQITVGPSNAAGPTATMTLLPLPG